MAVRGQKSNLPLWLLEISDGEIMVQCLFSFLVLCEQYYCLGLVMKGTSMGNGEAANPTKSDKAPDKGSSSLQEQPNMIPYPDWATLQTYYASGVSLPPPYIAAAVASGNAPPPYMWGAQPFMPPYGAPFPPYPHGVYGHPTVPLGAHSQSRIVPIPSTTEAVVTATPISTEPLDKSSNNKGKGLLRRLKRLDGLPVSNGGHNAGSALGKAAQGKSLSDESTEEDSNTVSDEISEPSDNKTRNRSSEDHPTTGKDEKAVRSKVALALINSTGKSVVTVPPTSQVQRIESNVTANGEVTTNAAPLPRANKVPIEIRKQEDGILKREKRKQSNRESARRSRMRKQAETEELAASADTLSAQNTTLKTEITVIRENSKKLKMENITLLDALKKTQLIQAGETSSEKVTPQTPPTDSTKNFLSKLSEPVSFSSGRQETDSSDKSRGKRHQQLVASSRADAVAAS